MSDGEKSRRALDETILLRDAASIGESSAAAGLAGTRLQHFALVRLLGRGGMGAVYYGTDLSLERPVAIKVLALDIAHDPEIVERFEREARAQARLRHPNVAQIYFIGEDRGFHFFVMEYLEGPGLDAVLAKGTPLPWTEAVDYTLAAARGLRAALAQGFVHRDVKPSNLMLDNEADIKILDFGLVKSMHGDAQLTRDGAIIGSPLYMAPEQLSQGRITPATDVWALGLVAFYLLAGTCYWMTGQKADSTWPAVLKEVSEGTVEPPRARLRELGKELELPIAFDAWFLRCTATDPKQGFGSAGEAIQALKEAMDPPRAAPHAGRAGPAGGRRQERTRQASWF